MTGSARVERQTKETQVSVVLTLDGSGSYAVQTDSRFLDHMLETLARYAGFDLELSARGDLEHHIVEDSAIALGQAFRQALGDRPVARIGHDLVPMDDCLVRCAVDLVERPYYAGELPVPLWDHWFRSFSTEGRFNLHLHLLHGRDWHHATEAAFKALGRSLRTALAPRADDVSTKGRVEVK